MSKFSGKDSAQKEFLKLFDSLTGAHSRWEVWMDMIVIFATTISNAVDRRYWNQREQQYMSTIAKYSHEQQQVFAELFAMLVLIMDQQAQQHRFSDFLGELFMNLNLGNNAGGQFFTPYNICRAMAKITMKRECVVEIIDKQGYVSINDPACGAGATLIAAAEALLQWDINFQQTAIFIGQDIDYGTALMCYVQLSLLGCAGYVRVGNTLTDPMTGNALHGCNDANTWFTPMWYADRWQSLRFLDRVKRYTDDFATAIPDALDTQAGKSVLAEKACKNANPAPTIAEPKPEEESVITFTVGKNGQLSMF